MRLSHYLILLYALLLNLCSVSAYAKGDDALAERIVNDHRLDEVDRMAKSEISQGLNAGSGYSQIVGKYILRTGDSALLGEVIAGHTVLERINMMIDYLKRERYRLLYGAMCRVGRGTAKARQALLPKQ